MVSDSTTDGLPKENILTQGYPFCRKVYLKAIEWTPVCDALVPSFGVGLPLVGLGWSWDMCWEDSGMLLVLVVLRFCGLVLIEHQPAHNRVGVWTPQNGWCPLGFPLKPTKRIPSKKPHKQGILLSTWR